MACPLPCRYGKVDSIKSHLGVGDAASPRRSKCTRSIHHALRRTSTLHKRKTMYGKNMRDASNAAQNAASAFDTIDYVRTSHMSSVVSSMTSSSAAGSSSSATADLLERTDV